MYELESKYFIHSNFVGFWSSAGLIPKSTPELVIVVINYLMNFTCLSESISAILCFVDVIYNRMWIFWGQIWKVKQRRKKIGHLLLGLMSKMGISKIEKTRLSNFDYGWIIHHHRYKRLCKHQIHYLYFTVYEWHVCFREGKQFWRQQHVCAAKHNQWLLLYDDLTLCQS